jgi:hypothetical protein
MKPTYSLSCWLTVLSCSDEENKRLTQKDDDYDDDDNTNNSVHYLFTCQLGNSMANYEVVSLRNE